MKSLTLLLTLPCLCLSSGQQWTGYLKPYPNTETQHNYVNPNYLQDWGSAIRPNRPNKLNIGGVNGVLSPDFSPYVIPQWYDRLNGQAGYLKPYPNTENQYNYVNTNFLQDWGPAIRPNRPNKLNIGGVNGVLSPNFSPYIIPKWYNRPNWNNIPNWNNSPNLYNRPNWYDRLNGQVATKTFVGNEMLRNNGIQNNLGFNGRRTSGSGVQIKQDDRNINNYVYVLNKTNDEDQQGQTYTSMLSASLPDGAGSQYLVRENNENWIHPVWNPQPVPLPPNPYQNECDDLLDIIRELRIIIHENNLSVEKHHLRELLLLIKMFIQNNNLEYSPFHLVLRKLARTLLRSNDHSDNLREEEIVQILEEFKNRELLHFFLELRSNPDISLAVVVSKLARLLHRLKVVLIHKRLSQESIKLVINRAVQWSVPLVAYYFEKECKIRTQQYIVQNLELALDVKLENVQHLGNLDELQPGGSWGDLGRLDNLGGVGGVENAGNIWGSQGNIGGLGGVGTVAGSLNSIDSGNVGHLGGPGNQVNVGDVVDSETPVDIVNSENSNNIVEPLIRENLGVPVNQLNQGP